jgi:glycosyltransferase involved in cell wall biosynthesis
MQSNPPLISVALCTYNGEKYIADQLESILRQTYTNLEIVIVDDNSADNTFDIISRYAAQDSRIKCFKNDVNLGFNKNFEKALSLTNGRYIAISDQDDIWLPGKLQTLLDHISTNWLIFSNSSFLDAAKPGRLLKGFKMPVSYKAFLLRNYVTGHTALINREFLDYVLPFPSNGFYDWWMGFVAAYYHKITFCDEMLTYYRVHSESVIQKRLNSGKVQLMEYETIDTMLGVFEGYKVLKPDEKLFIQKLHEAYRLKRTMPQSIPLMNIVRKHYHELFPYRKPWKSLTKWIFARKFSKGIANLK